MVICGTCEFSRPEINYSLNSDGIVYYRTQRECSTTVIHPPSTVPVPVHHRRHPPWAITNCFYQLTTSLDFEIGRVMVFHSPLCLILMLAGQTTITIIIISISGADYEVFYIQRRRPGIYSIKYTSPWALSRWTRRIWLVGETELYQITRSQPRSWAFQLMSVGDLWITYLATLWQWW